MDYLIAESLDGVVLDKGWAVVKRLPDSSTGGNFGIPYVVERKIGSTHQQAFLKALSLARLKDSPNFAEDLQKHVNAFNFEKETLSLCLQKGMRRIATLLDAGQHKIPNSPLPICYIIFELAHGDVRKHIALLPLFNLAWTLRTLHQVAVGLNQLHTHGIAHQDLKPSNVLLFESFGAKIGDLGCADSITQPGSSPRGTERIPGDPTYAPPELRYHEVSLDWRRRRLGCDLYLLGNLIVFFFTKGLSMTAILRQKTHSSHQPANWPHDYRSVLPYLQDAFEQSLLEIQKTIPVSMRSDITVLLRWLCDPDPRRRGHPKDLEGSQFNLERVISFLNLRATKAEFGLLKA